MVYSICVPICPHIHLKVPKGAGSITWIKKKTTLHSQNVVLHEKDNATFIFAIMKHLSFSLIITQLKSNSNSSVAQQEQQTKTEQTIYVSIYLLRTLSDHGLNDGGGFFFHITYEERERPPGKIEIGRLYFEMNEGQQHFGLRRQKYQTIHPKVIKYKTTQPRAVNRQ